MRVGDQGRLAGQAVKLYRQSAPESCAVAASGSSEGLNLNCPLVRSELCAASRNGVELYRRMGRASDAIATATGAVRNFGCPSDMFR